MNSIIAIQILLLGFNFVGQTTYAGPSTSGGGVGVICQNGDVTTVKILDLYEAQVTHLNLIINFGSVEQNYSIGLQRVRSLLGDNRPLNSEDIENARKTLTNISNFTTDTIPLTSDIGNTSPLPKNCNYIQIAVFNDKTNSLLVNKALWFKLDAINKAALMMHEFIYKFQRVAFYTTSEQTRYIVRQIFSAAGPEFNGPYYGVQNGKAYICNAGDVEHAKGLIFLWQEHKITLISLAGEIRLAQTTIEVPVSIEEINFTRHLNDPAFQDGLMVDATPQNFEIKSQSFESILPIPHITWRQVVAAGKMMEVGLNIGTESFMYPVQSCVLYK